MESLKFFLFFALGITLVVSVNAQLDIIDDGNQDNTIIDIAPITFSSSTGEPLWTANFTNMLTDCPAGNATYGILGNGTWKCISIAGGGGSGDITSVLGDGFITNGSTSGEVNLVFNTTRNNATIILLASAFNETTYANNNFLRLTGGNISGKTNISANFTIDDSFNLVLGSPDDYIRNNGTSINIISDNFVFINGSAGNRLPDGFRVDLPGTGLKVTFGSLLGAAAQQMGIYFFRPGATAVGYLTAGNQTFDAVRIGVLGGAVAGDLNVTNGNSTLSFDAGLAQILVTNGTSTIAADAQNARLEINNVNGLTKNITTSNATASCNLVIIGGIVTTQTTC